MKSSKPILIVEDDKIDAMTIKRALREIKVLNDTIHLENGEEALTYLRNKDTLNPCIILLDLNMPKMNGIEFLKEKAIDKTIRKIPVVVLTTSKDERDRIISFDLGIAGYMLKPVDYQQFVEVIKTIDLYWSLSQIPED
jgi:CheY-like chemotaxis protein